MLMPEFPSCLCLFPGHMIGSVLMRVGVSGGEFVAELVKERLNTEAHQWGGRRRLPACNPVKYLCIISEVKKESRFVENEFPNSDICSTT